MIRFEDYEEKLKKNRVETKKRIEEEKRKKAEEIKEVSNFITECRKQGYSNVEILNLSQEKPYNEQNPLWLVDQVLRSEQEKEIHKTMLKMCQNL